MRSRILILILIALSIVASASSCDSDTTAQKNREDAVGQRNDVLAEARRIAPEPKSVNFPIRKALVKYTERQDLINHPWYIYILNELGTAVGYYVGQTYPVNSCDFLSSTEDIQKTEQGTVVVTAPSYDGIYYGGAGSTAGCDAWFFFDSATDAMIVIRGMSFFVADQPLALEAEPIAVGIK